MITTGPKQILDYAVLDPDINFSDHLPLLSEVNIAIPYHTTDGSNNAEFIAPVHTQLRWDHADLISMYRHTSEADAKKD